MRIGFYHESAGTKHAGGVAVYIQQMAAHLSRRNDVVLYTQSGEITDVLTDADMTIVETPSLEQRYPDLLYRLSPLSTQDTTKAAMAWWGVHNDLFSHMESLDVLCTFNWLDDVVLSNLVDVPTIYSYHAVTSVGAGGRLHQHCSRADAVIANSADTARKVEDAFGHSVDGVVYPGVDTDHFSPKADPAISSPGPVILFVGRLVESKGVFDLLQAVAAIEPPVSLHLVGHGDVSAVRERVRALGLESAVTLHGEVAHMELPGLYTAADIFCLPSHTESFGMVNLEAMACGTPVVSTDLPSIRRYLTPWAEGLLAEPGDPVSLAGALETLLSTSRVREAMGVRGREQAKKFTWETQSRRFEARCAELLEGRAETPVTDDRSGPVPMARRSD